MAEFLEAYGSWLALGLLFVLMLRMHAGGGCGGSHRPTEPGPAGRQSGATDPDQERTVAPPSTTAGRCH